MSDLAERAALWFRADLCLVDNPAWAWATANAERVLPFVTLDQRLLASVGEFRRTQYLANVAALREELRGHGGDLLVVSHQPGAALHEALGSCDVLCFNNATSAFGRSREAAIMHSLPIRTERFWGTLIQPPGAVLTAKGTLSRVFTPFWKTWDRTPLASMPQVGTATIETASGDPLPEYSSPPHPPGSDAAFAALNEWCHTVDDYESTRDIPSVPGTSGLSAALRFGTISPRTVLETVGTHTPGRAAFVRQLAWRDWYAHLLMETPSMLSHAFRPEYDAIRWEDDPDGLQRWKAGQTGYPIVDAGMRQLAQTGWMHNRVRMIAASFLVKDLLIDWRHGEEWFRHLLVDADPAQNAGNWQWVAGTGTDAAPYFRIFNPITQSRRFDPAGVYISRWVPELAGLDASAVHAPWESAPLDLAAAGVVLGDSYPAPIVDHAMARERTLAAYKEARGG
ncbi:MAG: deoxyribodipyrimidine photo-lyase [Acidimicrobiales bacterium]|nr:deoxyribodipyrimidine photo-lyase [Acidimicrobiales bacterium]RZV45433.1 MAG: deoxyribodipyrimidine photo-lyase [Acidimicrobiales bacterium]